ncbi:MAG: AraC family transcriptional regulator [Bacteroidota bacterium]
MIIQVNHPPTTEIDTLCWLFQVANSVVASFHPAPFVITAKPGLDEPDKQWLREFKAYLHDSYASPNLRVPDIAADFAMSESSLLRQVKRLTGLTPAQCLRVVRLEQARNYLNNGTFGSIKQVAYAVGYNRTDNFTRNFKTRFGLLPSACLLR